MSTSHWNEMLIPVCGTIRVQRQYKIIVIITRGNRKTGSRQLAHKYEDLSFSTSVCPQVSLYSVSFTYLNLVGVNVKCIWNNHVVRIITTKKKHVLFNIFHFLLVGSMCSMWAKTNTHSAAETYINNPPSSLPQGQLGHVSLRCMMKYRQGKGKWSRNWNNEHAWLHKSSVTKWLWNGSFTGGHGCST